MLIALLAVLGVNLIVIVVLLGFVLSRKRWGRGYGRWVRDVLVWTKGPFFFRNELVAVDGLDQQRPAGAHEIKRLGDHPIVTRRRIGRATL
jgi:hypothetical protein